MGILCCGDPVGEVICAEEILLIEYVFLSLALMKLAHFTY